MTWRPPCMTRMGHPWETAASPRTRHTLFLHETHTLPQAEVLRQDRVAACERRASARGREGLS
jgi:hypothetical protein